MENSMTGAYSEDSLTPIGVNFRSVEYSLSELTTLVLSGLYDLYYNTHYAVMTSRKMGEESQKIFEGTLPDCKETIKEVKESLSLVGKVKSKDSLVSISEKDPGILVTDDIVRQISRQVVDRINKKNWGDGYRELIYAFNTWEHETAESLKTEEGKERERELLDGLKELNHDLIEGNLLEVYTKYEELFITSVLGELEMNDHIKSLGKVKVDDIELRTYALNVMCNPSKSHAGYAVEYTLGSIPYVITGYMRDTEEPRFDGKKELGVGYSVALQVRIIGMAPLKDEVYVEVILIDTSTEHEKEQDYILSVKNFILSYEDYLTLALGNVQNYFSTMLSLVSMTEGDLK